MLPRTLRIIYHRHLLTRMISDKILRYGISTTISLSVGLFKNLIMRRKNDCSVLITRLLEMTHCRHSMKLVLVTRTDLGMGKGKTASQCAHAAVCCYKKALVKCPDILNAWELLGQPKIVLKSGVNGEEYLLKLAEQALDLGLVTSIIRDAGKTQIEQGTVTAIGIGPGHADHVDKITKHLKLL